MHSAGASQYSHVLYSMPSGGLHSVFSFPMSFQLVLSTVPPDSCCKHENRKYIKSTAQSTQIRALMLCNRLSVASLKGREAWVVSPTAVNNKKQEHNAAHLESWKDGRVGLTSHRTHYTSYRGRVFTGQMTKPTVSKH